MNNNRLKTLETVLQGIKSHTSDRELRNDI